MALNPQIRPRTHRNQAIACRWPASLLATTFAGVRRDLVGVFGGVMTLTVRFVFRDAQTGNEVFRTELTSTGGPVFSGVSVEEMQSQAMFG